MSRFKCWYKSFIDLKVNILYFIFFFIFIFILSVTRFFWQTSTPSSFIFFVWQAFGQCFLEAGGLLLFFCVLDHWMPKWVFYFFVGLSFLLLLAHFTDFTVARLMDTSISYVYRHFFGSGIRHFIPAIQALNLNGTMIAMVLSAILLLPFLGILLYMCLSIFFQPIAWKLSPQSLILSLLVMGSSLSIFDIFYTPLLDPRSYAQLKKALPFGTTLCKPTPVTIALPWPITKSREEKQTEKRMEEKNWTAVSKPNIFLFIIETLRKDFITEQNTPEMVRFGRENLCFQESFSNANSTQNSWFAIFHADLPYHWTSMRDTWQKGSIPLRILKNWGYKISVFSSADLKYFQIDQLLFGKNRQLADRIEEYSEMHFIQPWKRDQMGLEALLSELDKKESQSGNVFLIFFDATHSEYSFPPDFPVKFAPICEKIDYFTLNKKNIETIKNRYRNACAYVDTLLGQFFTKLKEKHLYDQSIIAITGDHGEEFFEEGAIFHGTHLNHYQTSVPIYYKFQTNPLKPQDTCTTHLDIFPSILHHLTGQCHFTDLFDGQSIFDPARFPYRIAVLNNGPGTPFEFSLARKEEQYQFRFSNPTKIYESKELEVISIQDSKIQIQALDILH